MKYSRVLFGVVYPVLTLIAGMIFLANMESAAGTAEFAALGIFIILLFVILPVTIVVNFLSLKSIGTNMAHYKRGMIPPASSLYALSSIKPAYGIG